MFKWLKRLLMKQYKLIIDGNEYLVTITDRQSNYVTTKDASGTYRNVRLSQLIEI